MKIFLCLFILHASFLLGRPPQEVMMLQALDIVKNTYQVGYAPAEWKKKWIGWELETEIERAKDKIRGQNLSLKDFHIVLRDFFNSAHDYHAGVKYFSTEHAYVPFKVRGVNQRYFISSIDREKLTFEQFPFEVGDELISFNGKPTHEEVLTMRDTNFGVGSEETDLGLAEIYLTNRHGSFGHIIPKGSVDLVIRSKEEETCTLNWIYYPEKITSTNLTKAVSPRQRLQEALRKDFSFRKLDTENEAVIGGKNGFLPILGECVWQNESSEHFHAYIFESPQTGKYIGFIRIADYAGSDEESEKFGKIINLFEENTEALIIDQLHNNGGYLFYAYSLTAMLIDRPLHSLKHKVTITQKDVMDALDVLPLFDEIETDEDAKDAFGETLDGIDMSKEVVDLLQNYFKFVISEWEAGNLVMNACFFYGFDTIQPNTRYRYTKPLLILTDGLDFSCADLFPALMQDNKRALILGSKTAGAGGYVAETTFPNLLGIESYYYTASIVERMDGSPIENLGVIPDIEYHISENDLQNNYSDFVKKILETVDAMSP